MLISHSTGQTKDGQKRSRRKEYEDNEISDVILRGIHGFSQSRLWADELSSHQHLFPVHVKQEERMQLLLVDVTVTVTTPDNTNGVGGENNAQSARGTNSAEVIDAPVRSGWKHL